MQLPTVLIGDFTKNIQLSADFNTGKVQIKKINDETSKPIENVTFELLDANGNQIGTAITNQEGIANFEGLYEGNYQVREISTGENFILNTESFELQVEWNKTTTKTITNSYKKGSVKVEKIDAETQEPIEGVTFQLIDIDGNIVQTGTTDERGEILFEGLIVGEYQLKEIETNENYILNEEDFDIKIEYNQTTIQTIQNERKKGNLQIDKVDKDDAKIGLSGVTFELYSKELQKIVGTYTTDEEGKIYIENLRIGEYELREIETKEGYEIGESMNISIQWEKTMEVTIENKKIPTIPKEEPIVPKEEPPVTPKKEIEVPKKLPKTGF